MGGQLALRVIVDWTFSVLFLWRSVYHTSFVIASDGPTLDLSSLKRHLKNKQPTDRLIMRHR